MVAGYFAQRARREHQTLVLRVLKEVGSDFIIKNGVLPKDIKAKYNLKGVGKISKFLLWAGVDKEVVDAFYNLLLSKEEVPVRVLHKEFGYHERVMKLQSESKHFRSCMAKNGSYYNDYIDEDMEAFNLGLVGMVVVGDIEDPEAFFARAKYRFLFAPGTKVERDENGEGLAEKAVCILLEKAYPSSKFFRAFVEALQDKYPDLPVATSCLNGTEEVVTPFRSGKSIVLRPPTFAHTVSRNLYRHHELRVTPSNYNSTYGYQDTAHQLQGTISRDNLRELEPLNNNKVVSQLQKAAYKSSFFDDSVPTPGNRKRGLPYVDSLSPSGKFVKFAKSNQQERYIPSYLALSGFNERRVQKGKSGYTHQSRLLRRIYNNSRHLDRYAWRFVVNRGGYGTDNINICTIEEELRSVLLLGSGRDLSYFYLSLLGIERDVKRINHMRRAFHNISSLRSQAEAALLTLRENFKEEVSMLPLPTNIRSYLSAFSEKEGMVNRRAWIEKIKEEYDNNPRYTYEAFLFQGGEGGFLGVKDGARTVLVSCFFENEAQRQALKDVAEVFDLVTIAFWRLIEHQPAGTRHFEIKEENTQNV
jgi:hypothetical protein